MKFNQELKDKLVAFFDEYETDYHHPNNYHHADQIAKERELKSAVLSCDVKNKPEVAKR